MNFKVFKFKNSSTLVVLFFVSNIILGQKQESKNSITTSYGFVSFFYVPNIITTEYFQNDTTINEFSSKTYVYVTDRKIKPVTIKYETYLTKKSTIGFIAMYNSYSSSGMRIDSTWNPQTNAYTVGFHELRNDYSRLRLQIAYTRYYYLNHPKLNTFLNCSAGASFDISKTYVDGMKTSNSANQLSIGSFPISLRISYGLRYNFIENMGLICEFGLGGPLVNIGLCAKF
jgi:hypothetical protein